MSTLSGRLKESQLWELYCDLEVKIIPLLAGMGRPVTIVMYYGCLVMQETGIQMDTAKLLKYSDMLKVCW